MHRPWNSAYCIYTLNRRRSPWRERWGSPPSPIFPRHSKRPREKPPQPTETNAKPLLIYPEHSSRRSRYFYKTKGNHMSAQLFDNYEEDGQLSLLLRNIQDFLPSIIFYRKEFRRERRFWNPLPVPSRKSRQCWVHGESVLRRDNIFKGEGKAVYPQHDILQRSGLEWFFRMLYVGINDDQIVCPNVCAYAGRAPNLRPLMKGEKMGNTRHRIESRNMHKNII